MMLRVASRALTLSLACLLAACAGLPSVSMNAADRAAIKTVAIQPNVSMPTDMFFHGRAQSFGAVGGLIGAALAAGAAVEPKAQIISTLSANDISLEQIVKTEFARAANAKGGMTFAEGAANADASLTLSVNVYGFGQTQGFSALLYPLLNVSASLKNADGKVIWQGTDHVSPLNSENDKGYEFQEYLQNPELLRQVLTKVSGIVSRSLAAELSGKK